jgi:hypothetical protein
VSKGTKVQLGGEARILRYDLNAVAEIGDKLGLKVRLAHLGEDLMDAPLPLSALRTVIWAGLLHAEPELEERTVGGWIDEDNWQEVFQAFFARFGATSPETQATVMRAFGQQDEGTETSASAEVPKPATLAS